MDHILPYMGHMWPYMVIYGPHMDIYGHIWWPYMMAIYDGHIWSIYAPYMAMYIQKGGSNNDVCDSIKRKVIVYRKNLDTSLRQSPSVKQADPPTLLATNQVVKNSGYVAIL